MDAPNNPDWQPGASRATLQKRAALKTALRDFFAGRNVLEVDTPALSPFANTDPQLDSIPAGNGWLQTSPEFAMKRLLAAGSGDIWQLCPVWRAGESGRRHNPEFHMLEWYRVGFSLHDLILEVDALLRVALPERTMAEAEIVTYRALFQDHLGIDPFRASDEALAAVANGQGLSVSAAMHRNDWLDLLMAACIEPELGKNGPCFVTDYPADQAALAQIIERDGVAVGERFECYLDGIELANGYHELANADEQARRFAADNAARRRAGKPIMPIDPHLIAALEAGLPDCSGVALGFDRLLMIACGAGRIDEVIAFVD